MTSIGKEESERERERERERNVEQQSKHVLVLQKLLIQIFAREGFVNACPGGWIPRTPYIIIYIVIF